MSNREREKIIRQALAGVAEELIKIGHRKSGHVLVHFQNGVPMKVEWRTLAEPIKRPAHELEA